MDEAGVLDKLGPGGQIPSGAWPRLMAERVADAAYGKEMQAAARWLAKARVGMMSSAIMGADEIIPVCVEVEGVLADCGVPEAAMPGVWFQYVPSLTFSSTKGRIRTTAVRCRRVGKSWRLTACTSVLAPPRSRRVIDVVVTTQAARAIRRWKIKEDDAVAEIARKDPQILPRRLPGAPGLRIVDSSGLRFKLFDDPDDHPPDRLGNERHARHRRKD